MFDIAEPEPAVVPLGAAALLPLLSLEEGDAVEEPESGGAAGLLQPSTANNK
jgi:hypothetical protein